MRRNVAAGIGSNEQGEYCRAALQRSDRKEPRYKWPTLLFLTVRPMYSLSNHYCFRDCDLMAGIRAFSPSCI